MRFVHEGVICENQKSKEDLMSCIISNICELVQKETEPWKMTGHSEDVEQVGQPLDRLVGFISSVTRTMRTSKSTALLEKMEIKKRE